MRAGWLAAVCVPSLAVASEAGLSKACSGGDEVACEQVGLGVARGDWGAPALTRALERYLGPSCGRGHVRSCLTGLVGVRAAEQVDGRAERALLTGACLGGATFACYEVARAQPDVAARALDVACRRGESRACGLREGGAETWIPIAVHEGLSLVRSEGFETADVVSFEGLEHQFAMRSSDGKLEIRVLVEPLAAATAEYEACKAGVACRQSDPNAGYATRYELAAQALSNGDMAPGSTFEPAEARARFDAQWAASRIVGLRSDLGTEYSSARVFTAHRDGVADVTLLGLYDEDAGIASLWNDVLAGVRFSGRVGLGSPGQGG